MKKFKKVLALTLTFAMVLSLAACGGGDDQKSASGSEGKDVYKVGMEPTFLPFDGTGDNGDLIGLDVDLMKAIGEDQGFDVEFVNLSFDGLVPALQTGQIDIIASGMNADKKDRNEEVDFSNRYYRSGLVVAVANDNTTINSINDLTPDMKVAAQTGTTSADMAEKLAKEGKIKEAVILNGVDIAMMQLINNDVQAVINDRPVTQYYIDTQKKNAQKDAKEGEEVEAPVKIVGDVMNSERYGIAVQKGNKELLDKINAGLKNLKDNGKFAEIYEKWIGQEATENDLSVITESTDFVDPDDAEKAAN
ncbi:MAG: basic amino acid ABC transporter substrate-binding protein [Firmicutes bacterium]|nr:basic amino acid ABC transporter substrate-binding protein [Bacillota bacterium]